MSIQEINVDELANRLDAGAVLIDVREPKEIAQVRVPRIIAIPLGQLTARMSEVPDAPEVYVICRSGHRSATACKQLIAAGRQAVNVAGGTNAWVESGRPTESGD